MANPIDVLCTAPEFKALTCPYTGKPLEVYMLIFPGRAPMFHAPDAYAPAIPFPSVELAYRRWNRVGGIEGLKSDKPITCAYTGKVLAAASSPDGHYFTGGFDPRMFYPREEFLKLASSRDGVSAHEAGPSERIEAAPPDMKPVKPREFDTDPTDEALHIAADVLQKHKDILPTQASTTVSMSVPHKTGKKSK